MTHTFAAALSGLLSGLTRGYRVWRADQLMPSILFDRELSRLDDLGLNPDHSSTRRGAFTHRARDR
jgi:hypothetical protein